MVTGIIHKIIVGSNPKDGMAFAVGNFIESRQAKVVEINRDHNFFKQTGKEKFYVLLENKENIKFVWNEITDMPTFVQYGDPKDTPISVK